MNTDKLKIASEMASLSIFNSVTFSFILLILSIHAYGGQALLKPDLTANQRECEYNLNHEKHESHEKNGNFFNSACRIKENSFILSIHAYGGQAVSIHAYGGQALLKYILNYFSRPVTMAK